MPFAGRGTASSALTSIQFAIVIISYTLETGPGCPPGKVVHRAAGVKSIVGEPIYANCTTSLLTHVIIK